ncbi:MAG TPA: hypothetical protein VEQ18_04855, partial [Candidatus Nitrosocosmicus sp.]|nr:hypothetical protein [Candidatus Nitrosocosmicus sp.]
VFSIPQKELLNIYNKQLQSSNWQAPIDQYLLFLSLFNSTELVEFRNPAQYLGSITDSIIANNIAPLVKAIYKINSINNKNFRAPKIVIDSTNSSLENFPALIQCWQDVISDYSDYYHKANIRESAKTREEALTILIKRESPKTASLLADWAAKAGEFPTSIIYADNINPITISQYWKEIIIKSFVPSQAPDIDKDDLADLIDHCEEYIPHGTVAAAKLMKVLRLALLTKNDFLGLGELTPASALFTIAPDDLSNEDKFRLTQIHNAPTTEPNKNHFPDTRAGKLQFLIAKSRYDAAKKYHKDLIKEEEAEQNRVKLRAKLEELKKARNVAGDI